MGTEGTSTKIRVAGIGRRGVRRAAILTLLVVGSTSATAQEGSEYRGTRDQQMACIGDVFRLCSREIPDVSRIVGCLVREKSNLTIECRAVFDRDAPRTASNHWSRHHRRVVSAMGRRSLRYGRRND
jgi:hypothetical protein